MNVIFHSDEFSLSHSNDKNLSFKIDMSWKDGYVLNYAIIWIPKSQIENYEKKWLDKEKGEFLVIIDIPMWLIKNKKLLKYKYTRQKDLDIHIHNLKLEMMR